MIYTATATRVGSLWHIDISGVGATQATSREEIDEMARDYIASMYDVDPQYVDVRVQVDDTPR